LRLLCETEGARHQVQQETSEIGVDHLPAEVPGQGTEKEEVGHASLLDVRHG